MRVGPWLKAYALLQPCANVTVSAAACLSILVVGTPPVQKIGGNYSLYKYHVTKLRTDISVTIILASPQLGIMISFRALSFTSILHNLRRRQLFLRQVDMLPDRSHHLQYEPPVYTRTCFWGRVWLLLCHHTHKLAVTCRSRQSHLK